MHKLTKRKSQSGEALIMALVAGALLIVLMLLGAQLFNNYRNVVLSAIESGKEEDLRLYLRRHISCSETIRRNETRCNEGGLIRIFNEQSGALISNADNGQLYGDYTLRARCVRAAHGYDIRPQIKHANERNFRDLFTIPIACQDRCRQPTTTADPYTVERLWPSTFGEYVVTPALRRCGLTNELREIRRSTGGSGGSDVWTDLGTEDAVTLTEICDLLGYDRFVPGSTDCRDGERSHRYPIGKCNFHSPGDDTMDYFDGSVWRVHEGPPKYAWTYLKAITCEGRR